MRVIHVVHWPKSGIVNLIHNQIVCSNNSTIEYHIIFFLNDPETTEKFLKAGAKVICYNFKYIFFILFFLRLLKDIIRVHPDVVHTHSFMPRLFVSILSHFNKRFKVISTFHNTYPYLQKTDFKSKIKTVLESKSIISSCCKLIVVSNFVREYLLKHTAIPSSLISVIHPGVLIFSEFIPYEVNYDNHVVIVGRLDKQKRHDRLLEIWQKVVKKIPEAQLDIVGDGVEKNALIAQAETLGISNKVNFLGFRADIPQIFRKSAFSVLTSAHEGLPLVVIESFLQRKTVVAFDTGPLGEIIDTKCGIFVPPWDLDMFSDRIVYLLKNKHVANRLGKVGYEKASTRFDAREMTRKIEHIYHEILS